MPRLAYAAGCTLWSPRFADVGRVAVAAAHALGQRVSVWTVNEAADIERALDLGVDTIITERPDRVRARSPAAACPCREPTEATCAAFGHCAEPGEPGSEHVFCHFTLGKLRFRPPPTQDRHPMI